MPPLDESHAPVGSHDAGHVVQDLSSNGNSIKFDAFSWLYPCIAALVASWLQLSCPGCSAVMFELASSSEAPTVALPTRYASLTTSQVTCDKVSNLILTARGHWNRPPERIGAYPAVVDISSALSTHL